MSGRWWLSEGFGGYIASLENIDSNVIINGAISLTANSNFCAICIVLVNMCN